MNIKLDEIMHLEGKIIMLCMSGSNAYGLQKFFTLLTANNPNIIELMGISPEDLTINSEIYRELKANIQLFLSKKIANTFGGYASAQLSRIKNVLIRDSNNEEEKEEHVLKSVKKHFYENQEFEVFIGKDGKICINADLREYPLKKLKWLASNASNTIENYDNLNYRNNKKDIKKLYKHAMHLIRLLKMGNEILMTGQIFTKRPDREFLNVRNYLISQIIQK